MVKNSRLRLVIDEWLLSYDSKFQYVFQIETFRKVRIVARYVAIGGGELLSPIMCVTSSAY